MGRTRSPHNLLTLVPIVEQRVQCVQWRNNRVVLHPWVFESYPEHLHRVLLMRGHGGDKHLRAGTICAKRGNDINTGDIFKVTFDDGSASYDMPKTLYAEARFAYLEKYPDEKDGHDERLLADRAKTRVRSQQQEAREKLREEREKKKEDERKVRERKKEEEREKRERKRAEQQQEAERKKAERERQRAELQEAKDRKKEEVRLAREHKQAERGRGRGRGLGGRRGRGGIRVPEQRDTGEGERGGVQEGQEGSSADDASVASTESGSSSATPPLKQSAPSSGDDEETSSTSSSAASSRDLRDDDAMSTGSSPSHEQPSSGIRATDSRRGAEQADKVHEEVNTPNPVPRPARPQRHATKTRMYMCECGCEQYFYQKLLRFCAGGCEKLLNEKCVSRTWRCSVCNDQREGDQSAATLPVLGNDTSYQSVPAAPMTSAINTHPLVLLEEGHERIGRRQYNVVDSVPPAQHSNTLITHVQTEPMDIDATDIASSQSYLMMEGAVREPRRRLQLTKSYSCECGCEGSYLGRDMRFCAGTNCWRVLREECVSRTWRCPECYQKHQNEAGGGYTDADYINVLDDNDMSDSSEEDDSGGEYEIDEIPASTTRSQRKASLSHNYLCDCGCGASVCRSDLVKCRGRSCMKLLRRECCAPGVATYKCHECAANVRLYKS